jgi:hypothetical protein
VPLFLAWGTNSQNNSKLDNKQTSTRSVSSTPSPIHRLNIHITCGSTDLIKKMAKFSPWHQNATSSLISTHPFVQGYEWIRAAGRGNILHDITLH